MSLWRRLNRRYLIRYRAEYVIAVTFVYGVRALSPQAAWNLARWLGRLAYRFGVRRNVVLNNLAVAFPDLSEGERIRIAKRTGEHLSCVAMDIIFQRRMIRRRNLWKRIRFTGWVKDYMNYHGIEGLRRRASRTLFLTAHLGNWELGSGYFSLVGANISPVYRALRNPFVDRLVRNIRLDQHYKVIERRGSVQVMLDTFERGGNVGFLFDQEAVHGIYVPFFGVPACTHKTPAVLIRDYGVKVFLGVMVREGDFLQYEARGQLLDLSSFKTDDREGDLKRITEELMRLLEAEIRRVPDQYFWVHRRWKRVGVHGQKHMPEKTK